MNAPLFQFEIGEGPLVACAIHDGHATRPEVAERLKIDEAARRYEEDPFTADWTRMAPTRIVACRSRFEFDLNRPREKAVYLSPADCWELEIWNSPPPPQLVNRSLSAYDDFYAQVRLLLERLVARHGRVVVFDVHTYNHVRGGAGGPTAIAAENPEVNLGTGSMDRAYWSPIVECWLGEMRRHDFLGRRLDVRENVKFFGGSFPGWIHQTFPGTVCALAIEVKKFFMNEWTGELDVPMHQAIGEALEHAANRVGAVLETWQHAQPIP
jgi:N-formylglutamate amidohydrolase